MYPWILYFALYLLSTFLVVNSTYAYCYLQQNCFGLAPAHHGVVTEDTCCNMIGGWSWGVQLGNCQVCHPPEVLMENPRGMYVTVKSTFK